MNPPLLLSISRPLLEIEDRCSGSFQLISCQFNETARRQSPVTRSQRLIELIAGIAKAFSSGLKPP